MLENNKNLIANPVNFMDINEVDVCKIAKEELKKLSCESVVDAYNDYADQTGEEKFYTNDDDFFSALTLNKNNIQLNQIYKNSLFVSDF